MKSGIQPTSLKAYFGEVTLNLGERQREVFAVFRRNPTMDFTNTELVDELNRPINTITPRVYELRGYGKNNPFWNNPLLVENRKRPCKVTGRTAKAWALNSDFRINKMKKW